MQLVKKFPAFHGNRRFITALTSLRHPSLSWASPIQSIHPHPTSWRSILLLPTQLRLGPPVVSFPPVSPPRPYTPPSPQLYAPPKSFINNLKVEGSLRLALLVTNRPINCSIGYVPLANILSATLSAVCCPFRPSTLKMVEYT